MDQSKNIRFERASYHSTDFEWKDRIVLPEIADEAVDALVHDIEKSGVAVLPNYIGVAELEHLQLFVEDQVSENGNKYLGLIGKASFENTMLGAIAESPQFLSLIHRMYEKGYGHSRPNQTLYQVLRCLKGESGLVHSYVFHFDSYVVTALLPILIPETSRAGHLVMTANCRKIRSSYLRNLFDKLLLDNSVTQKFLRRAVEARRLGFKQIQVAPGNLYLFWGYRSIHANEVCDPEQIRATALFHFADPHAESTLRKITGQAKVRAATK